MATRHLYLVPHGEALPDESGLSERGRRQALLLGQRLREHPISVVYHGPLPHAAQTAHLIATQLGDLARNVVAVAGYQPGQCCLDGVTLRARSTVVLADVQRHGASPSRATLDGIPA